MPKFSVGGRRLEPFIYRRVSENGRRGEAHLVVCTNGDNWYLRSDHRKVQPATKTDVDYIFNERYQGTTVVKEQPPY
jgi:hypothetical protein